MSLTPPLRRVKLRDLELGMIPLAQLNEYELVIEYRIGYKRAKKDLDMDLVGVSQKVAYWLSILRSAGHIVHPLVVGGKYVRDRIKV